MSSSSKPACLWTLVIGWVVWYNIAGVSWGQTLHICLFFHQMMAKSRAGWQQCSSCETIVISLSLDQSGQFVKPANVWLEILFQRSEQYYYCWRRTSRICQETPSAVSLKCLLELQSFQSTCHPAAVKSSVILVNQLELSFVNRSVVDHPVQSAWVVSIHLRCPSGHELTLP